MTKLHFDENTPITDLLAQRGLSHRRTGFVGGPHEITHIGTGLVVGFFHANDACEDIIRVSDAIREAA